MNRPARQLEAISEHDPDALYFLPLGGSGEIGMNLNLDGYRGQWLIVDCGVTFGEEEHQPGVDVIMADPAFIVERRDRLLGIVATGGLAPLFVGATDAIDKVDPDLTLWGLRLIYRHNSNR